MASLYLFTGEYGYGLRAEVKRRREKFVTMYGTHNYTVIRADDFDVGRAIEAIVGWGLFVEKKLVVIYGIPSDTDSMNKISASKLEQFDQQFQHIIPLIPESTMVVFVSHKPDKRMKAYKTYTALCQVKEFTTPRNHDKHIVQEILGDRIDAAMTEYLLAMIGSDSDRIASECGKLVDRCSLHPDDQITGALIDQICVGWQHADNFKLFHYRLDRPEKAIKLIDIAHSDGVFWTLFAGSVYSTLKTLIQIVDCLERGINKASDISREIWGSPFVVNIRSGKFDQLKNRKADLEKMFMSMVELDMGIKTWKIKESIFWLEIKHMLMN